MARFGLAATVVNTAAETLLYIALPASPTKHLSLCRATIGPGAVDGADNSAVYMVRIITDENATPAGTDEAANISRYKNFGAAGNITSVVAARSDPTGAPTFDSGGGPETLPVHRRNTYRWSAEDGYQMEVPAVEDYGFALYTVAVSATAWNVRAGLTWDE